MRVQPVVTSLQANLRNQVALGTADAALEDAVAQLIEVLEPALQLAVQQLAEQAAIEVAAQLPEHTVDVVLLDGEPTLRISDARPAAAADAADEEFDARITLRLPPSLKELVEQAAVSQGASVNSWVVDAIDKGAKRVRRRGGTITEEFDL